MRAQAELGHEEIFHPRSSILDPRSSILDPRSSILDPRSSILIPDLPTIAHLQSESLAYRLVDTVLRLLAIMTDLSPLGR
ncbi:MAG: hypothetical protein ACJ8FY_20355 [Gemmataceae bacterium]